MKVIRNIQPLMIHLYLQFVSCIEGRIQTSSFILSIFPSLLAAAVCSLIIDYVQMCLK